MVFILSLHRLRSLLPSALPPYILKLPEIRVKLALIYFLNRGYPTAFHL